MYGSTRSRVAGLTSVGAVFLAAVLGVARTAHAQDGGFEMCEPRCSDAGRVEFVIGRLESVCASVGESCANGDGRCVRFPAGLRCVPGHQAEGSAFCCGIYACPTLLDGRMPIGCDRGDADPIGVCRYEGAPAICASTNERDGSTEPGDGGDGGDDRDAADLRDGGGNGDNDAATGPMDGGNDTLDASTSTPGYRFRGAGCSCAVPARTRLEPTAGSALGLLGLASALIARRRRSPRVLPPPTRG